MKDFKKQALKSSNKFSRRQFLSSSAAMTAFTIVPSYVLGANGQQPPSDKLNIAAIGSGGMGSGNISRSSSENIVALCDVNDEGAARTYAKHPKAPTFRDFRKMLDKEHKNIDAVIIATPDHTHAVAAMACMGLGKHVYVQKPLTHDIYEARMLTQAAHKYKVQTQMGNQGHSGEGIRLISEWIQDGAIGAVREVHAWTDRPIWPQSVGRPAGSLPVPKYLDWDLWLGTAPFRPFNNGYLPFDWRGFWDFGTGALGDMACHIIDPVFMALKLGYPTSASASFTRVRLGDRYENHYLKLADMNETPPISSVIHYEFPKRGDMPSVKLHWYDGGMRPERPEELEQGRRMGDGGNGVIFVGDKGKIMCGCYAANPRIIPEEKMKEYKRPAKSIRRIPGGTSGHEQDWIRACKDGKPASSNFDYSGPLTETVLMGNLTMRMNGERIEWDGKNMKVTNIDEANNFVRRQYRDGWSLGV